MFWWRASSSAVNDGRKALGVSRTANERTVRLVLAAARQGAEAVRAHEWTEEKRDRRRQVNAQNGLAANLILGFHGDWWAPEEVALLGTLPDERVARRTHRTVNAVRQKRQELDLRNPAGHRWADDELALLGTLPDREVARRLGRSLQSVTQTRCQLGIPNPGYERLRGAGAGRSRT
jgi:hypothetical protein